MSLFNEFGDLEENFDLKDVEGFQSDLEKNVFEDDSIESQFARETDNMTIEDAKLEHELTQRMLDIYELTGIMPSREDVKTQLLNEISNKQEKGGR